jgi:serine/threonine protein kinase
VPAVAINVPVDVAIDRVGPYVFDPERDRSGTLVALRSERSTLVRADDAGRAVLVKIPDPQDARAKSSVEREIRALSAVQSPHVIELLDWGVQVIGKGAVSAVVPYLVLPKFPGTLWDLTAGYRRSLKWVELVQILGCLASGLSAVHLKGFTHCDLGPDNVLITRTRKGVSLVLADFGEARPQGNSPFAGELRMNLYRPLDLSVSPAVDWYGFAVIAFNLLHEGDFADVLRRAGRPALRASVPRSERPRVNAGLAHLLSPEPAERLNEVSREDGLVSLLLESLEGARK